MSLDYEHKEVNLNEGMDYNKLKSQANKPHILELIEQTFPQSYGKENVPVARQQGDLAIFPTLDDPNPAAPEKGGAILFGYWDYLPGTDQSPENLMALRLPETPEADEIRDLVRAALDDSPYVYAEQN